MSGATFTIDNPYSGEIVAERRFLAPGEIEGVVARASRAQRGWARSSVPERVALCERFCDAFERGGNTPVQLSRARRLRSSTRRITAWHSCGPSPG